MKFKDLEIGQTFNWYPYGRVADEAGCKIGTASYKVLTTDKVCHVSKLQRSHNVVPHDEPPSMIAAARRDARWYLLDNMDLTSAKIIERAERQDISFDESIRLTKREQLLGGLDVLKLELDAEDNDKTERVLHDLIEIVRELV